MKKALLYIGIALAAIGCTKDADVDTPLGDNAMTFTSNIATRADKSAWVVDTDHIGVYMTSTSADATFGGLGANKDYAYKSSNSFTSTDPLYLPTSGSAKIFAYYPYVDGVEYTAYSIDSEKQVDILSATNDDVSSSNVELKFNHLLSKVSLTIEAGDGVSLIDLAGLAVTISGIGTKTAGFNLTDPTAAVTFSESTALTFDTSTTRDSNDLVTAISSSAIVIPQEFDDATLIFTTTNDDKYSATIPVDKFEVGLEYSYTVTIKKSEVKISSATINPWGNGDETSGSADIVDIEYKTDTYYINSAKGLAAFRDLVNGAGSNTQSATFAGFDADEFESTNTDIKGVLTRDIDLSTVCGATIGDDDSAVNWSPIGKSSSCKFDGTFNGGGYCVSGLYINSGSKLGLFGYLDTDGLVYNVGVKGTISTDSSESAGIVAYNYGWVMNSYSEVTLSGGVNTAGIAGYNIGNVVNCYNRGNVTGTNNVGGIVGQNAAGGYVGYSFSVGDVSGTARVGGVVGWNHTTTSTAPTIKGCFCLDLGEGTYSIGQLEYVSSSGPYDGNMYDSDYLTSDVFAAIMNNGTFTYNDNEGTVHATPPNDAFACAWNDNSTSDYPTLNFGEKNDAINWIYDIIYSSNTGTYDIYTAMGLKAFANLVNNGGITEDDGFVTSGNFESYFESISNSSSINGSLMDDIDLEDVCGATLDSGNGISWTPIGTSIDTPYSGTFNGNGKEVSNLYIYNTTDFQGLFGSSSGTISNLGVSVDITGGSSSIGGVAGYNTGTITNCYSSGSGVSSTGNSGGVVGWNTGYIINCYNSGSVSSSSNGSCYSGGIAGNHYSGTITNCYNSGSLMVNSSPVYNVVGASHNGNTSNCYFLADATDASTGAMSATDMKDASFIILLNSNAYTYNSTLSADATTACAWEAVTGGYPTLDFGTDPGITYSELDDFNNDSSYIPTGNVWYISDETASVNNSPDGFYGNDFDGLMDALGKVTGVTVIFSNLETLPSKAFENCTYLTSISLPSATTIESAAFSNCTALTSVTLPSATSIGQTAFVDCTSLKSLELPSAMEIGKEAFSGCTALTTLDLGSSGSGIESIGSDAFNKDTDTTLVGNIDLTIKISGDGVSVDENTLTYNTNETATFKSITEITNWALND